MNRAARALVTFITLSGEGPWKLTLKTSPLVAGTMLMFRRMISITSSMGSFFRCSG